VIESKHWLDSTASALRWNTCDRYSERSRFSTFAEGSHSGLVHPPAKREGFILPRGFESRTLRHFSPSHHHLEDQRGRLIYVPTRSPGFTSARNASIAASTAR
jgi:hypothetical protein